MFVPLFYFIVLLWFLFIVDHRRCWCQLFFNLIVVRSFRFQTRQHKNLCSLKKGILYKTSYLVKRTSFLSREKARKNLLQEIEPCSRAAQQHKEDSRNVSTRIVTDLSQYTAPSSIQPPERERWILFYYWSICNAVYHNIILYYIN